MWRYRERNIIVCLESVNGTSIGLYTPINYFGWYATCSHNKDGGCSHIQSQETIGQENHVTCLKLRPRVNFVLRLEPPPRLVFSINTSSSNTLSLFYPISSQRQHTPSSVNQQEWKATMDGPRRHTLTMRLFPVSEKPLVSNHNKNKERHFKYVILL